MKKRNILLFLASAFASIAVAQTSPPISIIKDWTILMETETKVYYSYVKCDNQRKILLKFVNEVPFNQSIKVKVTAKYLGYVFTEDKVISITPNQTLVGDCSSEDKNFFIGLTPLWDFDQSTIEGQVIEAKTN